jgi:hypothetical protein
MHTALSKNFYAAPDPTLLYSIVLYTKPTFVEQAKVTNRG